MTDFKPRNFLEKFTWEEHRAIDGVRRAQEESPGRAKAKDAYAAYQISLWGGGPRARGICSFGANDPAGRWLSVTAKTGLYAYCETVLHRAWALTAERFPRWLDHRWVAGDHISREISFTSPHRTEAARFCRDAIAELAADKNTFVSTSAHCRTRGAKRRLDIVINAPSLDSGAIWPIIEAIGQKGDFRPARETLRFSIDQVMQHITHVDDRLVVLANGARSIPIAAKIDREFMRAVENGHITAAEKLLARGANVNAIDVGGDTSLAAALRGGSERQLRAWLKLLLGHGADPNLFGWHGHPPLYWAVHSRPRVVKSLLDGGADPNVRIASAHGPRLISPALDHAELDLLAFPEWRKRFAPIIDILERAGAVRAPGGAWPW